MDYNIKHKKNMDKALGQGILFIDEIEELHTIIYDNDRGYAILNLVSYEITSDFHENFESMHKFTRIDEMIPVRQVNEITFEVV